MQNPRGLSPKLRALEQIGKIARVVSRIGADATNLRGIRKKSDGLEAFKNYAA